MIKLYLYLLTLIIILPLLSYQIIDQSSGQLKIKQLEEERERNYHNGKYKEAYEDAIEISHLYTKIKEWKLAIQNLYFGIYYSSYYDENNRNLLIERAKNLAQKYLNDDDEIKAAIYQYYGEQLVSQNEYDSAQHYLSISIKVYSKQEHLENWRSEIANILVVMANIAYSQHRYQKAIDYLVEVEIMAKELDNPNYILDISYNLLSVIYYEKTDIENAIYYSQKAAKLIESIPETYDDDSLYLAEIYQNLGVYYQTIKDYQRSKLYFEDAINYLNYLKVPEYQIIDIIINYGILMYENNNVPKAVVLLRNALIINNVHNKRKKDYLLNNTRLSIYLSKCYEKSLLLDSAFYFIEEAEKCANLLPDTSYLSSIKLRKGKLHFLNNEDKIAKNLILRNIPLIENSTHYASQVNLINSYIVLGKIYHKQKDYSQALNYFQKSIDKNIVNQTPYKIEELIIALENKAQTLTAINTPESLKSAYEHYQLAIKWTAKMRQDVAFAETKSDLNQSTSQLYIDALNITNRLYKISKDPVYLNAAFQIVEKQKSILLLETMIDEQGTNTLGVPKQLLDREENFKSKIGYYQQKILEAGENDTLAQLYQGYLDDYQLDFANLKDSLSEFYEDYFNLEYQAAIADINTVQEKLLDKDNAFIQFCTLDSAWLVFVIEQGNQKMLTIPFGEQEQQQLNDLLTNLNNNSILLKGKRALSDFSAASSQVYQSVFEPIMEVLSPSVQSLTIAADGQLNLLPFEVLLRSPIANNNQNFINLPYLIKDYSFHYGYSASLLLQNRNTYQSLRSNKDLLAFAPMYDNPTNTSLASRGDLGSLRGNIAALEGTSKEIQAISNYFDGYFDYSREATETAFKSKVKDYGLLHLAMHGQADQSSDNFSHLIFANDASDGGDDNKLYHYEIANLNTNAQLAVLSACETGVGKYVEGEGIMSLGRSFMYAGVPSVVMSLWKIEDNATSELMPLFYKNLASGDQKSEALRKAKLEYLDNSSQLKAHPFYWSGIVALGEDQPLKQSTNWLADYSLIGFILLLVLLILLIIFRKRIF